MLYLILAILLTLMSLMLDVASAWRRAVDVKQRGGIVGGTSILPGFVFFPAIGCSLEWALELGFPGLAIWVIGTPALLTIIFSFGYYVHYRYLVRKKSPRTKQ